MAKKTIEDYNTMAQVAAYKIVQALDTFKDEPEDIRRQAEQIIAQRVSLMRRGQPLTVEGDGLVTEVVEETPAPEPKVEPDVTAEPPTP